MHLRLAAVTSLLLLTASGTALAQKAPARRAAPTTNEPSKNEPQTEPAKLPNNDDDPNTEDRQAVYLTADLGYTRPNIGAFSNALAFDKTAANGFLAGAGVGYRYKRLRGGFRFRASDTTQFTLWSLMAEVGYSFPLKPITPVLFVHAGYMFDTGIERSAFASYLPSTNILTPNVDLDGLVLGVEAYGAIAITKFFKVGPFLGFDATFLHRAQPRLPESTMPLTTDTTQNALFGDSGHGVGYMLSIGVRLTGDVGF